MTGDFPDTKMDLSEYRSPLEKSALGLQKKIGNHYKVLS